LIEKLEAAGVKALGLDFILSEPSALPKDDSDLNLVLQKYNNIVLPVYQDRDRIVRPLSSFAQTALLGHIHIVQDSDGVVRRSLPSIKDERMIYPAFSFQLAKLASPENSGRIPS
jgi:CHASE2 domain-containing sensor protein